jgi:hypothetical protein
MHLPVEQRDALAESSTSERYDVIAGNPPWINWESLPAANRAATGELWVRYGLFSLNNTQARLGGGKKDLAMLFTYHCAEQYLQPGGKLGFVVPQSCFKSKSNGAGFRRFPNLRVLHIDDLSEVQPFQPATNKTAVLVLQRGAETSYPVAYILWRKLQTETASDPNLSLDQMQQVTYRIRFCATPLWEGGPGAPWLTVRPAASRALRRVIGQSPYRAYEGVNTGGLNGIYWLNIQERTADGLLHVENLWDAGRRKVRRVARTIEPDLVFPLLRGRDVARWHAAPSAAILLPQDPQRRRGYDEEWLAADLPQTYAFLKQFEQELRTERQSSMIQNMVKKGPFYSMYGVADHTFAPNKVVWREQASTLTAAVVSTVDEQIVVPDHKLMLVGLSDENEAHYLCACLSSSVAQLLARAVFLQTSTSTGLLDHIAIPQYDPANTLHQALSGISWQAHLLAQEDNEASLATLQNELDSAAGQLWGLTGDEQTAITLSLAELLGEVIQEQELDDGLFPML